VLGICWGLGGNLLDTKAHIQLLGIICAAMSIATAIQALMLHCDIKGWKAIYLPLLAGWASGSTAMVLVMLSLGGQWRWSLIAVGISLGQFLWLMMDMGRPLQGGDPDDFMKVVVSMDSTLLVIVSIPLFIAATCIVHLELWNPTAPAQGADEAA